MKQLATIFLLFVCITNAAAQKACFMSGGFIAAFYSGHDQKIKFINTYTNQAFASFTFTDGEPTMWFAGTMLVAVHQNKAFVASFQKNEKTNHLLTGAAVQGTLLQYIETADSVIIQHIVTGLQVAAVPKKSNEQVVTATISNHEKTLCLVLSNQTEKTISCYSLNATATMLWQTPIGNSNEYTVQLSFKGNLLALWDGRKTDLINTANGTVEQTITSGLQLVRFTVKDELICINQNNRLVTLFAKNKSGMFKSVQSELFKAGIYPSQTGKEFPLVWEEVSVSDDLTMAIGFGTGAVGLYKNGVVLLFF
jgi:hypothetical protein